MTAVPVLPPNLARRLTLVGLATATMLGGSIVAVGPSVGAPPHPVRPHLRTVHLSAMAPTDLAAARNAAVAATEGARPSRVPEGARALGAGFQSPVAPTGGALRVIGVTWRQGSLSSQDRVELRLLDRGRWGAWTTMATDEDHGPDPGSTEAARERGGTDPYVVTSQAVQVRVLTVETGSPDVRLDLIDPSVSAADSAPSVAGSAQAAGTKPTIYSRSKWGADEGLRRGTPELGTIKAGFVHHTVNANSYSSGQVPGIIRGIYAFHTQSRGWNDIGYNFLVDRFGRTWEGRAGGVDQPVIGAHTGGFNAQLFGAAAIGTFTSTAPPAATMTAFNKLFAWKLSLAHVDPAAKVTLTGMTTPVYTVSGHRDASGTANNTECPGNALYAKLATIRTGARSLMGAAFFGPSVSTTSWQYGQPGPTLRARPNRSMTWTLQVRSVCRTDVLATASGSATTAGGISAPWNGKLTSGAWAPPGDYFLSLTGRAGSGTVNTVPPYTVRVRVAPAPGAPAGFCPARIAGADRYATAVDTARLANPRATTVVLASGSDVAMLDALSAAPLARAKNAALLLTQPASLPASVVADIKARKVTAAYIVGGTGVISTNVQSQLVSLGVTSIVRYGGRNRYDTAAQVASAVAATAPDVFIASGRDDGMPDGMSLAGPGAALTRPILLVGPNSVPPETAAALRRLSTERTVVAGGTAMVPASVLAQLPRPTRLAGADRYATATAVASWARTLVPSNDVVLASGEQFAMVNILAAGQLGRISVYARTTVMPSPAAAWLDAASDLRSVTVVGGLSSINDLVAGRAQRAVLQ
jgi:putative cell wall-binding protein